MKKIFLLICFTAFTLLAKAQSVIYHAFKFDIGAGYAIPTAVENSVNETKAGLVITLQPHYRLSNNLALGIRTEAALLGHGKLGEDSANVDIAVLFSFSPTVEYYLSKGGFRPFIGAGAGYFIQSSENVNSNDDSDPDIINEGTKIGFFPELGFETGHFRISADYNVLGNKNNYITFKIGSFFGGGKKKIPSGVGK